MASLGENLTAAEVASVAATLTAAFFAAKHDNDGGPSTTTVSATFAQFVHLVMNVPF